jgi:hypothetical protein
MTTNQTIKTLGDLKKHLNSFPDDLNDLPLYVSTEYALISSEWALNGFGPFMIFEEDIEDFHCVGRKPQLGEKYFCIEMKL